MEGPRSLQAIQVFVRALTSAYDDFVEGLSATARDRLCQALATYSNDILPGIERRLSVCNELLKQGLRDEALEYAREEPDLVQSATLLDIERLGTRYEQWIAAAANAGIPAPTMPRRSIVAALVKAENDLVAIKPLLAEWRRLNLGRAPLPQRITILRKLRAADSRNPAWFDCLRDHEQFRLMEIEPQLSALAKAKAHEREAEALVSELHGEWEQEQPSSRLLAKADALVAKLREQRCDRDLDDIAALIEVAYRERNYHLLRDLVRKWRGVLAERGTIATDDPRLTRVAAAIDYSDKYDTHRALLAEVLQSVSERPVTFRARHEWMRSLERMLDEIEDTASRLSREDIDVGRVEAAQDRVALCSNEVRREERFRRGILFSALAASAAVLLTVTVLYFRHIDHERRVTAALLEIKGLQQRVSDSTSGDLAIQLQKSLPEAIRGDSRVVTAFSNLGGDIDNRRKLRQDWDQQRDACNEAIAEARRATRADPLAPWPESFAKASQALNIIDVSGLGVSDAEKVEQAQLAEALQAIARGYEQAADDALKARVTALEAEVESVSASLVKNPEPPEAAIAALDKKLAQLRDVVAVRACPGAAGEYADRKIVSPAAARSVAAKSLIDGRINEVRARLGVTAVIRRREERADAALDARAYGEYADMLRSLADDMTNDPLAIDYRRTADNVPLWKAVDEWAKLVERTGSLLEASSSESAVILKEIGRLSEEAKRLPFVEEAVSVMKPVLEQAADRTPAKLKELRRNIEKALAGQFGSEIDGVVWENRPDSTASGLWYCLLRDRPAGGSKVPMKYLVEWPGIDGDWGVKVLPGGFDPSVHKVADSPQKRLSMDCLSLVRQWPVNEAAGFALERDLLRLLRTLAGDGGKATSIPRYDPCLRALLVRQVLQTACAASPLIKADMEGALEKTEGVTPNGARIQIQSVDNEVFNGILEPAKHQGRQIVVTAREVCSAFLAETRTLAASAEKQISEKERRIVDRGLPRYIPAGRLRKLSGVWTIGGGDAALRNGAEVYVAGDVAARFRMVPVAVCDNMGQLPAGTKVQARAGEPLFVLSIAVDASGKQSRKGGAANE